MQTVANHKHGIVLPAFCAKADPDLVDRMIQQSNARTTDNIMIVGRGYLELLLGLCHRGFTEVCCEAAGAPCHHDAFDTLWLLHADGEDDLRRLLTGVGRALRPGGTVVVRHQHPASGEVGGLRVPRIRQLFADCGLMPLVQASDGGTGILLSAQRPPAAMRWPATA